MSENGGSVVSSRPEVLSPGGRLFNTPRFNCYVIGMMGYKTRINPQAVKHGLQQTLLKHPRFSSNLVQEGREQRWMPVTVDLEEHVIVPDIDPQQEPADEFVEDYVSNLTTIPLDASKPLWELHLLNVKTSDAEAVGVFRIHHSLGDGVSLVSLLLACSRKTSDPEALPTVPVQRKKEHVQSSNYSNRFWGFLLAIWTTLTLLWNTVVYMTLFVATILFLKDTDTCVKGGPGVELTTKRFVHRTVNLEDIKLVKHAMNVTINDVLLGVTQAALARYINRKNEIPKGNDGEKKKVNSSVRSIRLRAALIVNIRPTPGIQELSDMMSKNSKARWGNSIGYALLPPFKLGLEEEPLKYVSRAKAAVDRKKNSLEALCSYHCVKLTQKLLGDKLTAAITYRAFINTTLAYSNVVGPIEEISFQGHPVAYMAASVYGHAHALTVHFQSYMDKMTIALAVDPNVIPDPHTLCDDMEEALKLMRNDAVVRKWIVEKEP